MGDLKKEKTKNRLFPVVVDRLARPYRAMKLCKKHKRSLKYIRRNFGWKRWWNTIFVYWFVRGEDVGMGVIDPIFKFFPSLAPNDLWDIEMEFTTSCNIRCIQCEHSLWDDLSYKNQNITFEQFKHIIDQFPKLKWINPTGEGSPFLNRDFLKMLEYLAKKNVYTTFASEGFNWTHEISKKLVEIGTDRVWFSTDAATKQTYEEIRVGSNWEKVIGNIKDLINVKREMCCPLPEINFHFTVMNVNHHEVIPFIDLVADLNHDGWCAEEMCINFQQLVVCAKNAHLKREPTVDEIRKAHEYAEKKGVNIFWSHPTYKESEKAPLEWCVYWTEPYFLINGDVVPCCATVQRDNRDWLHKYTFGNIYKQSFREIWDSPRYKQFRKMVVKAKAPVPILCQGCSTFNTANRAKKYGVSKEI